jgi:hypothetical protein
MDLLKLHLQLLDVASDYCNPVVVPWGCCTLEGVVVALGYCSFVKAVAALNFYNLVDVAFDNFVGVVVALDYCNLAVVVEHQQGMD